MLDQNDLKQVKEIVTGVVSPLEERLRAVIHEEIYEAIEPIKQQLLVMSQDIADIKQTLARLEKQESEDIGASYIDIENLKKRVAELEMQVHKLQAEH